MIHLSVRVDTMDLYFNYPSPSLQKSKCQSLMTVDTSSPYMKCRREKTNRILLTPWPNRRWSNRGPSKATEGRDPSSKIFWNITNSKRDQWVIKGMWSEWELNVCNKIKEISSKLNSLCKFPIPIYYLVLLIFPVFIYQHIKGFHPTFCQLFSNLWRFWYLKNSHVCS